MAVEVWLVLTIFGSAFPHLWIANPTIKTTSFRHPKAQFPDSAWVGRKDDPRNGSLLLVFADFRRFRRAVLLSFGLSPNDLRLRLRSSCP